jgi:AcrR family transcriptional regulator
MDNGAQGDRQSRRGHRQAAQRADVLLAASVEFGRHGFERATMAAIAGSAGLAVGSLYKLFPSKQALHLALLERRADAILAHRTAPAPQAVTPAPAPALPHAGEAPWRDDTADHLQGGTRQRARSLQQRRAEILAAALRVFEAAGYHGATMAAIAAEGGMATGTLYNFFASKEALFHTLVASKAGEFFAYLRAEVDPIGPPAAKIAALIAAECAYYEANRDFLRIYITARSSFEWAAKQELGEAFRRQYAAYLDWVEEMLAGGMASGAFRPLDPHALAHALAGMLNATLFEWALAPQSAPLGPRAATLAQLFLQGAVA